MKYLVLLLAFIASPVLATSAEDCQRSLNVVFEWNDIVSDPRGDNVPLMKRGLVQALLNAEAICEEAGIPTVVTILKNEREKVLASPQ